MSTSTTILDRINKLIDTTIRNHKGPKLWKLSHEQLDRYRAYERNQQNFMQSYEAKHGHGEYYSAVISGKHIDGVLDKTTRRVIAQPRLDNDIKEILFTDSVHRITKNMTEDEAAEIYTKLLNREYQ